MPPGRPLPPLVLDDDQREQLQAVARSTSLPHGLVLRARIILASAEGLTNLTVAERVGADHRRQVAPTLPGIRHSGLAR